jgi:hypothetical protein
MDELRRCHKCELQSPVTEFRKSKSGRPWNTCKACAAAHLRAWREKNQEHVEAYEREYRKRPERIEKHRQRSRQRYHASPEVFRDKYLQRTFGISLDDYNSLLELQGGVCAICNQTCKSGRDLAVDHDHQTGQVRALLCMNCNRAIGWLQDKPELLMSATEYLLRFRNVLKGLG